MRTRVILASLCTASIVVLLAACGQEESSSTGGGDPVTITVTFTGDEVSPSGDRVEVSVGQPIVLDVTADAPGEIHVHSDPEQEREYSAGHTTIELDPIDKPGVVDVESHALEVTIVQLEVS